MFHWKVLNVETTSYLFFLATRQWENYLSGDKRWIVEIFVKISMMELFKNSKKNFFIFDFSKMTIINRKVKFKNFYLKFTTTFKKENSHTEPLKYSTSSNSIVETTSYPLTSGSLCGISSSLDTISKQNTVQPIVALFFLQNSLLENLFPNHRNYFHHRFSFRTLNELSCYVPSSIETRIDRNIVSSLISFLDWFEIFYKQWVENKNCLNNEQSVSLVGVNFS